MEHLIAAKQDHAVFLIWTSRFNIKTEHTVGMSFSELVKRCAFYQ